MLLCKKEFAAINIYFNVKYYKLKSYISLNLLILFSTGVTL